MSNLFFLGGPHGCGKTTLSKILEKEIPNLIVPELKTRTPKFYSEIPNKEVDFLHRQALKHAQRAIENYEYREIARNNHNKIILGNRGIYDIVAYGEAYFSLGWVSEEEKKILDNWFYFLIGYNLMSETTIILNPGFEVCKRHLETRWKTERKKFMEDNMDYLMAVCNAYGLYKNNESILYIDHEIDLNDKKEIYDISEWIEKLCKIERGLKITDLAVDVAVNV